MYWKDQKFSFSDKKFTENNFEVIDKSKINDPKNENINFSETKKNQTEKEKELKKLNQYKIKEQKEIKKDSNLLFN